MYLDKEMCVCERIFSESLPYCLYPSLVVESKGGHSTLPSVFKFYFICVCMQAHVCVFHKIHVHLYQLKTEFNCL